MSSPAKVIKVGHIGLKVNDLSRHGEFYTDTWGLGLTEEGPAPCYLRAADPEHHVLALYDQQRDVNSVEHVGLQVRDRDDLERAAEEIARRGLELINPPCPATEPGQARAMRFRDPAGAGRRAIHRARARRRRLRRPRREAHEAVPRRADRAGHRPGGGPLHGGPRLSRDRLERSLDGLPQLRERSPLPGRGRRAGAKLNHVAYEVHDWMHLARGIYNLGEKGVPRVGDPGATARAITCSPTSPTWTRTSSSTPAKSSRSTSATSPASGDRGRASRTSGAPIPRHRTCRDSSGRDGRRTLTPGRRRARTAPRAARLRRPTLPPQARGAHGAYPWLLPAWPR